MYKKRTRKLGKRPTRVCLSTADTDASRTARRRRAEGRTSWDSWHETPASAWRKPNRKTHRPLTLAKSTHSSVLKVRHTSAHRNHTNTFNTHTH